MRKAFRLDVASFLLLNGIVANHPGRRYGFFNIAFFEITRFALMACDHACQIVGLEFQSDGQLIGCFRRAAALRPVHLIENTQFVLNMMADFM